MTELLEFLARNADAGLAVIVLLVVLAMVVLGYLVTARHLDDWRAFAEKQEARANAAEQALHNRNAQDERIVQLIEKINDNILSGILRDRN